MGIVLGFASTVVQVSVLPSLAVIERASQNESASAATLQSELWGPLSAAASQPLVLVWFFFGLTAIAVSTFLVLSAKRRLRLAASRVPLALRPSIV